MPGWFAERLPGGSREPVASPGRSLPARGTGPTTIHAPRVSRRRRGRDGDDRLHGLPVLPRGALPHPARIGACASRPDLERRPPVRRRRLADHGRETGRTRGELQGLHQPDGRDQRRPYREGAATDRLPHRRDHLVRLRRDARPGLVRRRARRPAGLPDLVVRRRPILHSRDNGWLCGRQRLRGPAGARSDRALRRRGAVPCCAATACAGSACSPGDPCPVLQTSYSNPLPPPSFCTPGLGVAGQPFPAESFVSAGSNPKVLVFPKQLGWASWGTASPDPALMTLVRQFQQNIFVGSCGSWQEQHLEAARLGLENAAAGRQPGLAGPWPRPSSRPTRRRG